MAKYYEIRPGGDVMIVVKQTRFRPMPWRILHEDNPLAEGIGMESLINHAWRAVEMLNRLGKTESAGYLREYLLAYDVA